LTASDLAAADELGDNVVLAQSAPAEPAPAAPVLAAEQALTAPPPSPAEAIETPHTVSAVAESVVSAAAAGPAVLLEPKIDPAIAALCVPLSEADPCGPDLDEAADNDYLNLFASAEGILPTSFFSVVDPGKTFFSAQDEESTNARKALGAQIAAIAPFLQRTCDLRLLILRARLLVLNKDLKGFANTIAATSEWLDRFWDSIHPRSQGEDVDARVAAFATLELPTVIFPLQYTPLFEARRVGVVTYRAGLISSGEVKPRAGEETRPLSALMDAMAEADPAALASARRNIALLKASLGRIRNAFLQHGASVGLETLAGLVEKISVFINPLGPATEQEAAEIGGDSVGIVVGSAGTAPTTLAQAKNALEAIVDYYGRLEPSSPTLPLVRQAHQLIGKSFVEIMNILVPTQVDKAAFQIGSEQVFELPIARLPKLAETASGTASLSASPTDGAGNSVTYKVQSRSQAAALLNDVQRYFRTAEPSSPVPMLCERARALAERDFMGVLREVLPKAALKNAGT
jgi:type VI secretion system protein ImpA